MVGPGVLDLEYMDLDEFLSENGIPVSLEEQDDAQVGVPSSSLDNFIYLICANVAVLIEIGFFRFHDLTGFSLGKKFIDQSATFVDML